MKIIPIKIKVSELCKNYRDCGEDGVFGYDNHLTIRPAFQRDFVYKDKQRNAVVDSVLKGYPLNTMYWSKISDTEFEVLDGQQRTISICSYIAGDYSIKINGNEKFFHNLTDDEKDRVNNYELHIYVCEGTEAEKLEWFQVINIAGETLTSQELLNAAYAGPWLADAKTYFSRRNCAASRLADGYMCGNPIRQDLLEKVLIWIADRDKLASISSYMAIHQHDRDANGLWLYFQEVIAWAKRLFPNLPRKLTEPQPWGILYNKYKSTPYNTNELQATVNRLILDEDVTKQSGIVPYVLSPRLKHDEKLLSIRTFPEQMKRRVYEKQGHKCPLCQKQGLETEYAFEDMQGDHIIPWSKGGHTVESNLQLLCAKCNSDKSNH